MLCLSDFELYSPGVLLLFSQSKPIAFMPFSLPSPSSLLKLPSITFATWGGGGRGGEAHLPLNHTLNPTQIIQITFALFVGTSKPLSNLHSTEVAYVTGIVKYIFKSVFRHQNVGNFCLGRGGPRIPLPKLFLKNDSLTQGAFHLRKKLGNFGGSKSGISDW